MKEGTTALFVTDSLKFLGPDIKSIRSTLSKSEIQCSPFQLDPIMAKIKSHKSTFKKDIDIITDA
jgi:hypothetical protein